MESQNNKILLVYDLAGYGKVALSVMIPIFSHLKFETFNLPTALVSNTFDYGKFDILDTTAYMRNTIGIWDQLGFSFDAICTGFIASKEQSQLVTDYCRRHKERNGAKVFVDPVMADNGFLYNGVTFETVLYLRELCSTADVVLPNITEACFLTGVKVNGEERALLGASATTTTSSTRGSSASLVINGIWWGLIQFCQNTIRIILSPFLSIGQTPLRAPAMCGGWRRCPVGSCQSLSASLSDAPCRRRRQAGSIRPCRPAWRAALPHGR